MILTCLAITLVVILVVYLLGYCHNRHQHWQEKGIFVPPTFPIIGHLLNTIPLIENRFEFLHRFFRSSRAPFIGLYENLSPSLVVREYESLKDIMAKEADHFAVRKHINLFDNDTDTQEMVAIMEGDSWERLRAVLTPAFTSGKFEGLLPLLDAKCKKLVHWCLSQNSEGLLEVTTMFNRFTVDGIATCIFGVDPSSLENEDDQFAKTVLSVVEDLVTTKSVNFTAMLATPWLSRWLNHRVPDSTKGSLSYIARQSLRVRETLTQENDITDLLEEARLETERNTEETNSLGTADATVIGQSILSIFAGFKTTATTLAFASYLLAKHPRLQDQLREELRGLVEDHGELNYQVLTEAKFLEACLQETRRLYPATPYIERVCTKEYTLPGTEITIEEGMVVGLPIWTVNRDPEIWECPETFRPERFLSRNRNLNLTLHTFGQGGPPDSVGMLFAMLESKVALAHIILNLKLQIPPEYDRPLRFDRSMDDSLVVKGGINLNMSQLEVQ
ncbi:cytochrome P450 6k1-like [Oratosquilla oratoria]|uniref:cytochrome P450 6k1-like n=1 Tax=Oratosquilla oratoria TaxID=337810 RepID=UPI003F75CB54